MRLVAGVARRWAPTRLVGGEQLSGLAQPVVFVANHSSHFDTWLVLGALPSRWRRQMVVLAAADYWYRTWAGAFLVSVAAGTVPVERRHLSDETRDRIDGLLHDHWSVLLFPEGTRSATLALQPLRGGAAHLAVQHQIPLVPIGITGANVVLPPGARWPRRHDVTLRIGAPLQPGIDPAALNQRLADDLAALLVNP